jgi:hypothetical protein
MSAGYYPLFQIPVFHMPIKKYANIDYVITDDVVERNVIREPDGWRCAVNTSYKNRKDISWFKTFFDIIEIDIKESFKHFFKEDISCTWNSPWINQYKNGYFQEKHHHLNLDGDNYSYCYFHKLPDDKDCAKFVFHSDNYTSEWTTKTPFVTQDMFAPEIKEHDLIVFPCWVQHSVTKHKIDKQRVTISGNFKVEMNKI